MGISASRKAEKILRESPWFLAAVRSSFEDCVALCQHTVPGVYLYQLQDASRRIYHLLSAPAQYVDDPAFLLKQRWIPSPPTQADVDLTLRAGGFIPSGKQFLTLEEFDEFACCLFRDMAATSANHRLALYVPLGSIAMLAMHVTAKRFPAFRFAGLLAPGIIATAAGALLASIYKFPCG